MSGYAQSVDINVYTVEPRLSELIGTETSSESELRIIENSDNRNLKFWGTKSQITHFLHENM